MKFKQIVYQIYYRLYKLHLRNSQSHHLGQPLVFNTGPLPPKLSVKLDSQGTTFQFLNQSHTFENRIDWNRIEHGKLWTYHLNYFDYLNNPDLPSETGLKLINEYHLNRQEIRDGMEPYPLSLRGINWIKFFSKHNIHDYDSFLYDQYALLRRSLEYHLLGNHLLENAISLAFAASYFGQPEWASKATKIIKRELAEQVLSDGGHFELSPMYHAIIMYRLSDLYNLMISNPADAKILSALNDQLVSKLSVMGTWLNTFQFGDGSLGWVNDASISMMPGKVSDLLNYMKDLGIEFSSKPLSSSAYRRVNRPNYELLIDIGDIGAEYIPGHAHADSLNFLLNWAGQPLIVDTGTSTYEANEQRSIERSTMAHNTVTVHDENSSDVWASFRVGKRAQASIRLESETEISVAHDGYTHYDVEHLRTWTFNDSNLSISDQLIGISSDISAKLYLHFEHNLTPVITNNEIILPMVNIHFCSKNEFFLVLEEYNQAVEFNKVEKGKMVIVEFEESIKTSFTSSSNLVNSQQSSKKGELA
jgi:hypothetical protein